MIFSHQSVSFPCSTGSDQQRALKNAYTASFFRTMDKNMITYINCARHLEDNVRRHVTKNNATNDKKEQIVNAIFNARTGLYSSRTRTQYSEMYDTTAEHIV